jgi:hypothetical protein
MRSATARSGPRNRRRQAITRFWRRLARRLVADHPAVHGLEPETVWRLALAAGFSPSALPGPGEHVPVNDRTPSRWRPLPETIPAPAGGDAVSILEPYMSRIPDLGLFEQAPPPASDAAGRRGFYRRRDRAVQRLVRMLDPDDREALRALSSARTSRPMPKLPIKPPEEPIRPACIPHSRRR